MVVIMLKSFKVGGITNINGRQVTWRDENTLVIEPDHALTIVSRATLGDLMLLECEGEMPGPVEGDQTPPVIDPENVERVLGGRSLP